MKTLFCFLLSTTIALGAISNVATVEGEITDISKKTVTIKTKTGNAVVPRTAIKDKKKIFPGTHVKVNVNVDDLMKLNQPKKAKKRKKKR